MEPIYDAIKKKHMAPFLQKLQEIDLSDEEDRENILYRCIKANNFPAFEYIITNTTYFSEYFIRSLFGVRYKEPFSTAVLNKIQPIPEMYGAILAYTARFHPKDTARIDYLLQHPVLDFSNRIKDQIFLCQFLYVFMSRIRSHSIRNIRQAVLFLRDKVELERILTAFIMIGKRSYLTKKIIEEADKNKMVPFDPSFSCLPYGFSWYNDDFKESNPPGNDSEVSESNPLGNDNPSGNDSEVSESNLSGNDNPSGLCTLGLVAFSSIL